MFTPEERERTAKSVAGLLEGDDRIDAVLVVGSLASASADRWSDIDLVAVVSDDAEHAAAADEWVRRIYDQLPVLHHFATAFGETYVRGFLLENLLELDLAFTPQSQLAVWGPAKVAFDRSGRSAAASHTPVTWAPPGPRVGVRSRLCMARRGSRLRGSKAWAPMAGAVVPRTCTQPHARARPRAPRVGRRLLRPCGRPARRRAGAARRFAGRSARAGGAAECNRGSNGSLLEGVASRR